MDFDHTLAINDDETAERPKEWVICEPSECTRKRVTFTIVMFLYGFNSIGSLAFYSLLKDRFKLEPTAANLYNTIISFLFILKPLYGLLSDGYSICGRNRQPYMILAGLLASLAWVGMIFLAYTPWLATMFMCFVNIMMGMINTIAQAILVEDSQDNQSDSAEYDTKKAARNLSMFFSSDYIALLISSYLSGYMVKYCSLSVVFAVSACLPLTMVITSFILCERTLSNNMISSIS